MNIVATSLKEAAKLYGLVLKHGGVLKPLGSRPCEIHVKETNNGDIFYSKNEKSFKVWDAGNRIYGQCFISKRDVSYLKFYKLLTLFHLYS